MSRRGALSPGATTDGHPRTGGRLDDPRGSRTDDSEFTYWDDGTVTARHRGTGIVASGASYAEALVDLTDTLVDDEHDADPVDDPEAFLASLDLPSSDPGNE